MITLRQATSQDADFVFDVKRQSAESYDDPLWGWEDGEQRDLFRLAFIPEPVSIIQLAGRDIGVVIIEQNPTYLWLSEIYLLSDYRDHGIGTTLLRNMCAEADAKHIPIQLEVRKTNPARHLYERFGFMIDGETETYFQMTRLAN